LAKRLGTNSGTTSYHLRKLAEVGLVTDAPDEGDGRDRWWQAASRGHSWAEQDFLDDPDTAAAADWLHGHYLRTYVRAMEDWAEQRHQWPREWIAAADMSDQGMTVTPEGLRALTTELHEVLERHRQQADPGAPGAKKVMVVLSAFPIVRDL
ncbi:MAG TPA: winged helix-turn-helix domain-containing protein, partial [Euzebya sp.]|nr:winged helix-turn-helix domain-containing protein [Euzebya sp.]